MSVSSIAGSALNFVGKHPIAIGAGLLGLGIIKYATKSEKERVEWANYMTLSNPYLNPIGCMQHAFTGSTTPTKLDGIAGYMVERNNRRYEQKQNENSIYSSNVQEFYQNGGRGLIMDPVGPMQPIRPIPEGIAVSRCANGNYAVSVTNGNYGAKQMTPEEFKNWLMSHA